MAVRIGRAVMITMPYSDENDDNYVELMMHTVFF